MKFYGLQETVTKIRVRSRGDEHACIMLVFSAGPRKWDALSN